MKIYIIIVYRPLSSGSLRTPSGELRQLSDGRWQDAEGKCRYAGETRFGGDDELKRAIRFINKNSHYRHHIVVIIDNDVYPNSTWLNEFDNVHILKSPYIPEKQISALPLYRLNHAHIHGINNIANHEWLCYCYNSDLICGKDWDKYIVEAIQKYGENFVYVPMFTEVRPGYNIISLTGLQPTPQLVWEEWRKKICCHALTMPEPSYRYFTEADMDNFIRIADQYPKPKVITEKPGLRNYGYYNVMFMQARYAKKAIRLLGPGFDTDFDNRLYSECNLMKNVVTNSYVFHPFCKFKE